MSDQDKAQGNEVKQLSGTEGHEKIAELVKGIRIAMMTTVAEDGSLSSRPMAVQDEPFNGTLWFLTQITSEKLTEIEDDQHVTLAFADPGNAKYISLKGRASYNQDRAKIHELWNSMYKAWFPGGEDDPQIAVLKVTVTEGDYWEANSSRLVRGIKYVAAAVTGGAASLGEAGHVRV